MTSRKVLSFQDIISRLQDYWCRQGCVLWNPHHEKIGAGTFNPATLTRVLGPEPWNVAYVEPSFRPDDGRFADSPNRVLMHHQFQVILKPIPDNIQELYLGSLEVLGLDLGEHDIRFVEDNWESPPLSAWGLGWEVWLDGMEVTQYTYFQQAGGLELSPPACELTYGLERIAMYLQEVKSIWDLTWNGEVGYAEILKQQEVEFCEYSFNHASSERLLKMYELYEQEAIAALDARLVSPALDYIFNCSHTFNVLDTRGAIGLSERVKYFGRMRDLTKRAAKLYVERREEIAFPLLKHTSQELPSLAPTITKGDTPERLVLEIGCEELASFAVPDLLSQLKEELPKLLTEARLSFTSSYASATPRRLTAIVEGLSPRQGQERRRVKGPARSVCEKNPKALEGFCRRQGVEVGEVRYEQEGDGEFAFVEILDEGRSVGEVLFDLIPLVISKLKVASSMRWISGVDHGERGKVSFNRPIRWIVALFGEEEITTRYGIVESGRTTYGGRWARSPQLVVKNAGSYEAVLTENNILLDVDERKRSIVDQLNSIAGAVHGAPRIDEGQLDEVTQLVEWPTALLCSIDPEFLALPREVVVSTIEKHVRCFCLFSRDGDLMPYFIAVRNGGGERIEKVREGFEGVVHARLNDARFFVNQDLSSSLDAFRDRLKKLTFHAGAGSMFDKTERLVTLVEKLREGPLCALPLDKRSLSRAAHLSKADLGSEMVVEMTSLQGMMGRYYADRAGEDPRVAAALFEQYLPRNASDAIPTTPEGLALSIADRADTLVALFSAGVEPTGSADPFGLRREALALLQCALKANLDVSLREIFSLALTVLRGSVDQAILTRLSDFVMRRFEVLLRDEGYRHDAIAAALDRQGDNPTRAKEVIHALHNLTEGGGVAGKERIQEGLRVYLRCKNIVVSARGKGIRIGEPTDAVADGKERELLVAVTRIEEDARRLEAAGTWPPIDALLLLLSNVAKTIDSFFDEVTVMTDVEEERARRLGILARVDTLIDPIADLSKLITKW